MTTIVFASNNAGKVREINQLSTGQQLQVQSQAEFGVQEVAETGLTFVENAIIKARNASLHTGLAALADDSGLEVDALNGAPGIYSARYAGHDASDAANLQKLLKDMESIPEQQRTARFQCIMVYLRHAKDPTPIICQGTWEGLVLFESVGKNGFGYDPIFFVPTHNCSSAQLSAETKNRLSHRGQALRALLQALKQGRLG
ncbi:nucleoside-triphosphate diphosphatase [Achromatium sp. WMS3]|nr:nucleoside-triphosphate diphosphatase [Achromatium sp. WMS3]